MDIAREPAHMSELLNHILSPEIPFLRNALLAGLLASVPLGMVGTHVMLRRISYLAAAIAHCILGGIGLFSLLQVRLNLPWLNPTYGAIISALAAALLISRIQQKHAAREDSLIGAIWVSGMALGLLCFQVTPSYVDPMSYLFGNILLINRQELIITAILGIIVTGCLFRYHKELTGIAFDPEFAELRGLQIHRWNLLLLTLTALTIVIMVSLVGIVLVIALLTLPPALAMHKKASSQALLIRSTIACAMLMTGGTLVSYAIDLPAGPVIIGITGVSYLCSTLRKGN